MRQLRSFLFTGIRLSCTGCGACASVCPHSAITMREDGEGFVYPVRDKKVCTHCGLCDMRCPASGRTMENKVDRPQCFIASSKFHSYSLRCATIGVCTMCSEHIIANKGYVFGAELDGKTWHTRHIQVSSLPELVRIQNSKYIQSETWKTYEEVKGLLDDGKTVLYVGTPCQIAGLKASLKKEYDNLYTIDLVCHGTFSYKLIAREIEYWERKFKGKVENFMFRSKRKYDWVKGGIVNFDLIRRNGKVVHIERPGCSSPTYHCYAYSKNGISYNLRECCYKCRFRDKGRYGDLSVGDAWGIISQRPQLLTPANKRYGISVVLANTTKGLQLLDAIKDKTTLEGIPHEMAFSQPALRPTHREIPEIRYTLYRNAASARIRYDKMVEDILQVDLSKEYRNFIRKDVVEKIKILVKNMIYGNNQ